MTRRIRGTLFFSLVALFFITITLIFFYSLGWRFDFKLWEPTTPGIFYFKIYPRNADIKISGLDPKKTDFIFGSSMIENVPPGIYNVEIEKEGYAPWKKKLEVKERQATETKNVVLIPKNPNFKPLSESVLAIFPAPSGKKALVVENQGEEWAIKSLELTTSLETNIASQSDFKSKKTLAKIKNVKFSTDSKRAIIDMDGSYYILELWKNPVAIIPLPNIPANTLALEFDPLEYQRLLAFYRPEKSENLSVAAINTNSLSKIFQALRNNIAAYSVLENNIFYLDDGGNIYKTGFDFSASDKISASAFKIKKDKKYEIYAFLRNFSYEVFVKENTGLFYLNDENQYEKISEDVINMVISPDKRQIALASDNEIKIYFTEKKYDQLEHEKGEKIFLTRFSQNIKNISWFTNHYLLFTVGKTIKICETDERDSLNIYDLADFINPEIFWNQTEKKLYVISGDNLYASSRLTQ